MQGSARHAAWHGGKAALCSSFAPLNWSGRAWADLPSTRAQNMDGPGPSFQAELTIKRPDAASGTVSARLTGALCTDDQLRQALGGVVFREALVVNPAPGGRGAPFHPMAANRMLAAGKITIFHELRQYWARCPGWSCTGVRHTVSACNGLFIV